MFNSLFGNSNDKNEGNPMWELLTHTSQLDEIQEHSSQSPVVIFKHSTRCSVSRMALRQFESEFKLQGGVRMFFLDLLQHRDVSDEIADRFGVRHQSPQVILIKDGRVIFHDSHGQIDAGKISTYLP